MHPRTTPLCWFRRSARPGRLPAHDVSSNCPPLSPGASNPSVTRPGARVERPLGVMSSRGTSLGENSPTLPTVRASTKSSKPVTQGVGPSIPHGTGLALSHSDSLLSCPASLRRPTKKVVLFEADGGRRRPPSHEGRLHDTSIARLTGRSRGRSTEDQPKCIRARLRCRWSPTIGPPRRAHASPISLSRPRACLFLLLLTQRCALTSLEVS